MTLSSTLLPAAAVLSIACATPAAQGRPQPARATISAVAWLGHSWLGDAKPDLLEERWTAPAGGAMLAVSRTVKGDRMVAFEYLRIVERDGGLVYVAQPGGRPPTEFVLTAITD